VGYPHFSADCVEYHDLVRDFGARPRPEIVTLCGSTRFYEDFMRENFRLTMEGKIVVSVGFFMHSAGQAHGEDIGITPKQKIELDELHKRKIDLADSVHVINVGGYVGESTRSEITYAESLGKRITYLEESALV
jgi:hypothetical protein